AFLAREQGISWSDASLLAALAGDLDPRLEFDGTKSRVFVGDRELTDAIRRPEIGEGASFVSALPQLRAALLGLQRGLGQSGGIVAEGRDVGTVIFPDAHVKFFLTASAAERAKRRYEEECARGLESDFNVTLADIRRRDQRDTEREVAPLVCAA